MRSLSLATSARLFATGCTVGPVVDSLHNQCLLRYDILPISLPWPSPVAELPWSSVSDYPYFFCSSWTVPPLLGIAYVVLGGILPRLLESVLQPILVGGGGGGGGGVDDKSSASSFVSRSIASPESSSSAPTVSSRDGRWRLSQTAWIAVTTTAMIIKLSEFLQTHPDATITNDLLGFLPNLGAVSASALEAHFLIMLGAALSQWALLDGTLVALLAASITAIGGPLSELPFVAYGVWEYLPSASDYFPLEQLQLQQLPWLQSLFTTILGEGYQKLALSSITGPCYFAVTMDAIALGRWFDAMDEYANEEEEKRGESTIVL